MGIDAQTAISRQAWANSSEPDTFRAMRAADDTWLFKSLVRGLRENTGWPRPLWPNPLPKRLEMECMCISQSWMKRGTTYLTMAEPMGPLCCAMLLQGALRRWPHPPWSLPHGNSYERLVPTRTPRQAQVGPMKIVLRPFVFQKAIQKRDGSNTVLRGISIHTLSYL